jgi:hypothetical protein
MKEITLELFEFARSIAKKWFFWVSMAIEIAVLFLQIIIPGLTIPPILYGGIFLLGFFVANFQVYRDQQTKIPGSKLEISPIVQLEFEEGNQYSYRFEDWADYGEAMPIGRQPRARESTKPCSRITLHAVIRNSGVVRVNVLSVNGDIDFNGPFRFMVPSGRKSEGSHLDFPIPLEPKASLKVDIVASIYPSELLTDAQIAIRTRDLIQKNKKIPASVSVEFSDPRGTSHTISTKSDISLNPLCDLYVDNWRAMGKTDLANLATG